MTKLVEKFLIPHRFSRAWSEGYEELRFYGYGGTFVVIGCVENNVLKLQGGDYSGYAPEMLMYWITILLNEGKLPRLWAANVEDDHEHFSGHASTLFEGFMSEFEE